MIQGVTSSTLQVPKSVNQDLSCLMIALAAIILLGSVLIAIGLYHKIGNWSFAVGGAGLIVALCLIFCYQRLDPVQKKEAVFAPWDISGTKWLETIHLNRYFTYLAVKYPQITVEKAPQTYPIDSLNEVVMRCLSANIDIDLPVPLHVSGNHWALVYIDQKLRTIEYYDSKKCYGEYDRVIKGLNEIAQTLSQRTPTLPPYKVVSKIQKSLQPDSYECGPWVLYFLEERLKNPHVDFNQLDTTQTQGMIGEYRKKVMSTFLEMDRLNDALIEKEKKLYQQRYPNPKERSKKYWQDHGKLTHVERWKRVLSNQPLVPES